MSSNGNSSNMFYYYQEYGISFNSDCEQHLKEIIVEDDSDVFSLSGDERGGGYETGDDTVEYGAHS